MKRLICLALAIAGLASTASAGIVACPLATTLANLLVVASGAGNGCQMQDKIFSEFSYSLGGADAALVDASAVFTVSPGQDIHGWLFAHPGGWLTSFTLSYRISVAPGNPGVFIFSAIDSANTGGIPNGTSVLDTGVPNVGLPYSVGVDGAAVGNQTGQAAVNNATSVLTTSVATIPGGGILESYEQEFVESVAAAGVPEPATLGTMLVGGLALIGAGRNRAWCGSGK